METQVAKVPFIAFRTALEPLDLWIQWGELPAGLSWDGQVRELRARLRHILDRPGLREALAVASPDLNAALPQWLRDPSSPKGRRAEQALVRYFSRLCGRPTPFGLFAGHSVGTVGESTRLHLAERKAYRRHCRLDTEYLYALARCLTEEPGLQAGLIFKPNPTLYPVGGKWRFLSARQEPTGRQYHLVASQATEHLGATLERARPGRSLASLAQPLAELGATPEEAMAFVLGLVKHQLLVPDLEPPVTGEEPIHVLVRRLHELAGAGHTAWVLDHVRTRLSHHDATPLGSTLPYDDLADLLGGVGCPLDRARLFQVDLFKPAPGAQVGEDVLGPVRKGIDLLQRLFGHVSPMDLSDYREAFLARFDQQEVPLLRLLDPDLGIPFGTPGPSQADAGPLLAGFRFPEEPVPPGSLSPLHLFLLGRMLERRGPVLALGWEELEPFFTPDPLPLPDAYSIPVRVSLDHDRVHRVFCGSVWGPTGACMLARFCHGDPELATLVREYLAAEESLRPDAVFAEIAHLPEDRSGNVILRPLMRGHEIPLLAASGAPSENQIPLADLRVSVRDGRFILKSERLGREVVPRLTSAHHFQNRTLGIYRFLCSLQYQGICSPCWDWGALIGLPFLPRVEVGPVVLAPARWRLSQLDIAALAEAKVTDLLSVIQAWREARGIPRLVLLADGEHKLPVDFTNAMSVDMFLGVVRRAGAAILEEFGPEPSEQSVSGPEGRFAHELVVPFLAVERPWAPATGSAPAFPSSSSPRSLPPGSNWLYVKLYAGPAGADELLLTVVDPWVREAAEQGWMDQWHFLRYGDPDWHLRVRLRGDPGLLASRALPALRSLAEPFLRGHQLWRIQADTYERELERYGPESALVLSEALFHLDSEAALALVKLDPGVAGAGFRWQSALLSFDQFLVDLGYPPEQRASFAARMREGHLRELNLTRGWESQLGERYRRERPRLDNLFDPTGPEGQPLAAASEVLGRRSRGLAPLLAQLRALLGRELPLEEMDRRIWSYLHLSANRILRSDHRLHEAFFYDFLTRHYRAQVARSGKGPPPSRSLVR